MTTETDDRKNRSKAKPLPPIEYLRELFIVDPTSPSGLSRRVNKGRAKAGGPAGCKQCRNYELMHFNWRVRIDGNLFLVCRIIYAIHHNIDPGQLEIDHINGNTLDNSIGNLRLVTRAKNMLNRGIIRSNSSGIRGVHFCNKHKKWIAKIMLARKTFHLGYFDNINDARRAREEAELRLHGEFSPLARKEGV